MARKRPIDHDSVARRVEAVLDLNWPKGKKPDVGDVVRESLLVEERKPVEYLRWSIVPIDHAYSPHWIDGTWVTYGFICLDPEDDHVMPGAIWFRTVDHAKHGIDCYILAGVQKYPTTNDRAVIDRFYEWVRKKPSPRGQDPTGPLTADSLVSEGGLSLDG